MKWGSMVSMLALLAFDTVRVRASDPELPRYAGRSTCLSCHDQGAAASSCGLEPIPAHARAYNALSTPAAKEIAALSGIGGPPMDAIVCLECHSAGADDGRRWWEPTFRRDAGVQCETCHGPGSIHASARSDMRSTAAPLSGIASMRRGNRSECAVCHTDRASHHEVLQLGFARQPKDALYKTPVDLAISPDGKQLHVVCEHSDSVVSVAAHDGSIVSEVKVGHRPMAAVLDPSGRTLYTSNSYGGTLSVVDLASGRETRQIQVGGEPRGVAIAPSGRFLYVADSANNCIGVVNLEQAIVERRLASGRGPESIAVDPRRQWGVVTNVRPNESRFRDPPISELTLIDLHSGHVVERRNLLDANMLQAVDWIPGRGIALVTLMRTKNLVPATRLAQGWMITNGLGILWPDGRTDQVLLDEPDDAFPDPMGIAISPGGAWALVSSGGADEVAVIDVASLLRTVGEASDEDRLEHLPNQLGTSAAFVLKRIPVGANPRGVRFSPDGRLAYVCNALADSISVIDTATWSVIRTIWLAPPSEPTALRSGERLFHSAKVTFGRQFSCRSCHPHGHLNGLTFDIEADGPGLKPVDNRTLRGIFDTGPFKWEGTNPSLARQCGLRFAVFFTRQAPFASQDLDCLTHYVATIERPPNPFRDPDGLTLSQRRGKAVFEREARHDGSPLQEEQRCNYCHSGAYRTNRRKFAVATTMWLDANVDVDLAELFNADEFGELGTYFFLDAGMPAVELDVPHLTDLAAGAPFLHNGAARTLEEIWTRFNMAGRHGVTHDLTRQQFNDLIAYLKVQ